MNCRSGFWVLAVLNSRIGYWVLAVLLGAGSSALSAQAAQGSTASTQYAGPLQYGTAVSSDSVTIGEPFTIQIRVRAPIGSAIRFPDNPDSSGAVQARDPRTIVTADSTRFLDQVASYHVAAWDVRRQSAIFGDVAVIMPPPGREVRRVPITNVSVFVRSVLPADSALRVPKPARPLWETAPFPWWLLALLAAAIGIALWWWWRRRRRPAAPVVPAVDPYDKARADFARIEAMGLVAAGERTRFVSLVIEVMRDYLAARYSEAGLALTSRELVAALRKHPAVSAEALLRVLHDADLAKFAGVAMADERARAVARDARAIVEKEHEASQPRSAAQVAA